MLFRSAAIGQLAERYGDVDFVYPVHMNPSVAGPAHKRLAQYENVHLHEPLPYPDFVGLMKRAHLILTDSGGLQEEAPSLGVPVLVMRETTERPEAVAAGFARLVGTDPDRIVAEASRLLDNCDEARGALSAKANPFGDGLAGKRIVAAVTAAASVV